MQNVLNTLVFVTVCLAAIASANPVAIGRSDLIIPWLGLGGCNRPGIGIGPGIGIEPRIGLGLDVGLGPNIGIGPNIGFGWPSSQWGGLNYFSIDDSTDIYSFQQIPGLTDGVLEFVADFSGLL